MDTGSRSRGLPGLCAAYLLAALALLYLSYRLPRLLPGDFLTALYSGAEASLPPELKEAYRNQAEALITRGFVGYLNDFFTLDWGRSLAFRKPVRELIFTALPWTLLLLGSAHLLSTLAGFFAGVESAWRKGSLPDRLGVSLMTILEGIPEIGSGVLLLLVFSLSLGWFPAAGAETVYSDFTGWQRFLDVLHHLALPLGTLFLAYLPGNFLLSRAGMLYAINAPYMLTAKAKGNSPLRQRYLHAARNALLPVVTRFGVRLASLLTGALTVEALYSYPGLGSLLCNAIALRDLPLISGIVLVTSLAVLSITLILEFAYRKLDPRLRA